MKVVHFVHNYYGFSGASKQAKSIAKSLYNVKGIEPIFFTIDSSRRIVKENGVSVFTFKPSLLSKSLAFFKMIYFIKPDIVHFHGADFFILLLSKLLGLKVYWKSTLYGSDDFETLSKGKFGKIKTLMFNLIDCNNTLTLQIRDKNKKYIEKNKLVTIPNGVEVPESPCFEKTKLALIVAAVIPRKGVVEGVEFFKEYLQPMGYKLLVIGPSNSTLDGYSESYYEQFMSIIDDCVDYIGEVNSETVKFYLSSARFLIHLSKSEGMPNIVLEALAHAVYPITLDMDGLSTEIYEDKVSGFLLDKGLEGGDLTNMPELNLSGYQRVLDMNHFFVVSDKTYFVYKSLVSHNV